MAFTTSDMLNCTQGELVDQIIERLIQVLPTQRPIALHEPSIDSNAWVNVKDCLDSGWVSSVGSYVDKFEQGLSEYTSIPHAIATMNGTAALHTCLMLAGVKPGDEVLLPSLTFVGTANPVAAMGAIPHFVDSTQNTLGVDPEMLRIHLKNISEQRSGQCINKNTGRPIRAMIVVHILGHIAEMQDLRKIADDYGLMLIEDAAEALGSFRDGLHAGHWGDLTALSFNGNKIITTGGGGAVLTSNTELAQHAKHLTTTAKLAHRWTLEHDEVAFNYRMPNINAALGVAQIEKLEDLVHAKRLLASDYQQAFSDMNSVECFQEPTNCRSNQWLNLLLLPNSKERDALLKAAHEQGILLRPFWTPLHQLPMYKNTPRTVLPIAEALFECGVCLPSSATLTSDPTL